MPSDLLSLPTMLSWRTPEEKDWCHALIHESGHAVMAALQRIHCYGIFLRQAGMRAAALIEPLPAPSDLSNGHYLFLVAGSAAERNTLGEADFDGSRDDRRLFGSPQGATFDGKVTEAEAILQTKKALIENLASRVDAVVKRAAGDFSSFRVQKTNFGGVIEDFWVLLNEQELIEELQGNHFVVE
jgi:hypothetical protein